MTLVVDASVLLAIMGGEPGADLSLELARGGDISWLNAGEVFCKVTERGGERQDAVELMHGLGLRLHTFVQADAHVVADMLAKTRHVGLSFGDRACLALGLRLGKVALTAERRWMKADVGVQVRLLR